MFSKRHLEAIAAVIRDLDLPDDDRRHVWSRFDDMLHTACGFDTNGNRRFKRDRFVKACNVVD